jgi:hypothetical protein
MIKLIQTVAMVAALCLTASPAFSQGGGAEWDKLNQEAMSLYKKGQYDRAVVVARKARSKSRKKTPERIIPMWPRA